MARISIIVPTLNEAGCIAGVLGRLQVLRDRGHEIIVVDGGSTDETLAESAGLVDRFIHARRGRAAQMAAGVKAARHDVLWFVHADTWIPEQADALIAQAMTETCWGRFEVRLSGRYRRSSLRLVESLMNLRSCVTGIATGDQAIFVSRDAYLAAGGMPQLPLMEDIALSRRLKRQGRAACIAHPVITSSRRWEEKGVWRTIFLMWSLRLGYALGVSPVRLARLYG